MIDLPRPIMELLRDGCRDEAFARWAAIVGACECMADLNDAMRNRDLVYGLHRSERRQGLAALIGAKFREINANQSPWVKPAAMRATALPSDGPMETGT